MARISLLSATVRETEEQTRRAVCQTVAKCEHYVRQFVKQFQSINQSINQSTFVKRHKSRANRRRLSNCRIVWTKYDIGLAHYQLIWYTSRPVFCILWKGQDRRNFHDNIIMYIVTGHSHFCLSQSVCGCMIHRDTLLICFTKIVVQFYTHSEFSRSQWFIQTRQGGYNL